MKRVILLLCLGGLARTLPGQSWPPIGSIDVYGLHSVSEDQVRRTLGVKEGDPPPPSAAGIEKRLEAIPGVVRAKLSFGCCEEGKSTLSVGIEETGAPQVRFHSHPTSKVRLPAAIVASYHRFESAMAAAVLKGDNADDLTQGHSLMANPAVRALQEQFIRYAKSQPEELRQVLRRSADAEHRAMAAYILGYAPKKSSVLDDLQYAVLDPEEGVRNNAMRALAAIAVLARRAPEQNLRISSVPFIELLNSIAWTDRNKAMLALTILTESRSPEVLRPLRERAVPALAEMARWKSGQAEAAYRLLGRIAGLSEEEIQATWTQGREEREKLIVRVLNSAPGRV